MAIKEGLQVALNEIRETSIENGTLYAKYVPEIYPTTDIGSFSAPILEFPKVANEFIDSLIQRIIYTQVDIRLFRNPLQVLEGEEIPLGSIGQEIFINPIKGRKFNVDDFAGLLAKYEADIKVQYHHLNSDIQYPVTVTRAKLKDAFTSWETLNDFINGITTALYNGAYIDRYNMTKELVTSAYEANNVQIETVSAVTSEATAKAFVKKARNIFLNMQTPTSNYNAWNKVGGYGWAIETYTPAEDIVLMIRNDVLTELNVDVLASAFNIDRTTLLGNIIPVNDFDIYENQIRSDGEKVKVKTFDGSAVLGIIADRRWFRILPQELTMDEFYNANNRTWQYYLNDVRMYSYSLFANAVVFATALPEVKATAIEFTDDTAFELPEGSKTRRYVKLTPANATSSVTFTSADSTKVAVTKISDREVEITGADADATAITITATTESTLTDTISVTCTAST